jgi:hypothetical protein
MAVSRLLTAAMLAGPPKDVDRRPLRQHLELTPQRRLERLVAFMRDLDRLRQASRGAT